MGMGVAWAWAWACSQCESGIHQHTCLHIVLEPVHGQRRVHEAQVTQRDLGHLVLRGRAMPVVLLVLHEKGRSG